MTQLDRLLAELEPSIRKAFEVAMQDLRDGVDYPALVRALERGDIEAAIRALNIEPAAFNAYFTANVAAYTQAGVSISLAIPVPLLRFDMSNPRAENWIREHAATRIKGYIDEEVQTVRRVIGEGYAQGQGPQNIAIELAGRVDRSTGKRKGGIIGVSDPQAGYVRTVREALNSGDYRSLFVKDRVTGEMRPRFTRMDGRDLRTIKAALANGKTLTPSQIEKIAGRYSDRLIAQRALVVAQTETAGAVMGARNESYRQALEKAGLPDEALTKTWIHAGAKDKHARIQHIIMNDTSVQGLDGVFTLPDGSRMLYAHDPAGGARNNVSCRCDTRYKIDFGYGVV